MQHRRIIVRLFQVVFGKLLTRMYGHNVLPLCSIVCLQHGLYIHSRFLEWYGRNTPCYSNQHSWTLGLGNNTLERIGCMLFSWALKQTYLRHISSDHPDKGSLLQKSMNSKWTNKSEIVPRCIWEVLDADVRTQSLTALQYCLVKTLPVYS